MSALGRRIARAATMARRTAVLPALVALLAVSVAMPAEASAASPDATLAKTGNPDFMSRPRSKPIRRTGGSNIVIKNISIDGGSVSSPSGIGIWISNVHGSITIRNVDLSDLVGGIYIYNSSGTLLIENVRSRNIGNGTIGSGHSNHIQLNESSFKGRIRGNQLRGGQTEDMISLHRSGGRGAGAELIIAKNRLQGMVRTTTTTRKWTSSSGSGIIVGDGAGDSRNGWTIVRYNTLLTPGQVGIQHIDGPGIQTYGNVVYGQHRPQSNNSLTSWGGYPRGVVRDNRYYWVNEDGVLPAPWFHNTSLTVYGNRRDSSINPDKLRVKLN